MALATVLRSILADFFLQMLMPKKNRIAIYELLFKEGVMVAKKDVHMPKHPELADKNVPNLHVMKAMQVAGVWVEGAFPLVFKARSGLPVPPATLKGCKVDTPWKLVCCAV